MLAVALELPGKIERLSLKLSGSDSLLSPEELNQQLTEVLTLAKQSSGATKQQLNHLATSLENNLKLALLSSKIRPGALLKRQTNLLNI